MKNILIVDNNTSYIESLKEICKPYKTQIVSFKEFNTDMLKTTNLVILSGGHPNSVQYEHSLFEEELKAILRSSASVIGICLGFELIVYAFGGKLKELPKKEKGIVGIDIEGDDSVFEGISSLKVYESHRWVAASLPKELVSLARSRDGIEIVRHITRFLYGFQFHPEIVVDKNDLRIFKRIVELGLSE